MCVSLLLVVTRSTPLQYTPLDLDNIISNSFVLYFYRFIYRLNNIIKDNNW